MPMTDRNQARAQTCQIIIVTVAWTLIIALQQE